MKEIYIYVEGGGNTSAEKALLRTGLDKLFEKEKNAARDKMLVWKLVPSGGRDQALKDYKNRVSQSETNETLVILLVDSEEPCSRQKTIPKTENAEDTLQREQANADARLQHLATRDPSWDLKGLNAQSIHLMVQCMEAWLVADPDSLAIYYGQNFHIGSLPKRQNLEEEPKNSIFEKLAKATKDTKKNAYAKIKHASKLLALIDPEKVAVRCPHFETFRVWLLKQINEA